ncbi:MAG TPA: NAD(P)-dependent oxidoreductase, partial [Patescibacteria group bacterium]|nr:NAD(P)-dependent oxidoreductase [Patescibacteria group bacterium]
NALDALLEGGHEVHAVARRPGPPREGVTWHEADLLAPGAAEGLARAARAEDLLHLAWYAAHGSFWTAPENERWIDASLRLLRAFGEAGGRRAAMAGTCAEYAWGEPLLRERGTSLEPATLYGACKHATHVAASALARQLGVSLAWGRIFFLYGPGEDPGRLVASVARGLLAGEEVPTTEGLQERDFMHVRDVAGALVALLCSEASGAVNIASGRAVPVRDLVSMIAAEAGGSGRVRFGELPSRPDEPPVIAGDAGRLLDEVGFRPQIGLEQGIRETVASLRGGGG